MMLGRYESCFSIVPVGSLIMFFINYYKMFILQNMMYLVQVWVFVWSYFSKSLS